MKRSSKVSNQTILKQVVQAYLAHRPLFFSFIRPQEATLFHQTRDFQKGKILDFGCGDGFFANQVWSRQSIAVGLDIESSRIQEARTTNVYQTLQVYDGITMPFAAAEFDTVVSNCVFEHLPHLHQNVTDINRVLKPGGVLITSVMANHWDNYLAGKKLLGARYTQFMRRRQVHQNLLSFSEWKKLFQKSGFEVIEAFGYLDRRTSLWLDLSHYLSIPSLITHSTLGRWQVFPNWFRLLALDSMIAKFLDKTMRVNPSESAAIFFVLQKK